MCLGELGYLFHYKACEEINYSFCGWWNKKNSLQYFLLPNSCYACSLFGHIEGDYECREGDELDGMRFSC